MKKFALLLVILASGNAAAHAGSEIATMADSQPAGWQPGQPITLLDGSVVFDFSYQGRFEAKENAFEFDSSVDSLTDDSYYLQRFRLGVNFKPASWLNFYAQGQDASELGSLRPDIPGALGAEGDDPLDLRHAYVEIGDLSAMPLSLKIGRQVLSYGDQRLIGGFEWNNIARTFDAAKLRYQNGPNSVDLFFSSVVRIDPDGFNTSSLTGSGTDSYFGGIYSSLGTFDFQTTDIYALWFGEEGGTSFATLGTRFKSTKDAFGPWDYSFEGALQTGEVLDLDLFAFAASATVGYSTALPWSPRLFAGYSYGSGDGDPTDSSVGTFQNLYPTNHLYYGYLDAFSWQNMSNPQVGVELEPSANLKLRLDYHLFGLADTSDAWYRANGTAKVRPISPDAGSFAGSELDLTATYKVSDWLSFLVGYSHFFAGDYLEDTGAASDADFGYVQVRLDF